ncbi:MAG: hypothetical protein AMS17_04855 [Spirochaetes bacterium DG_61]|jgi:hypothetical protein|nr:MAG: hypothetical protein AMS17_04855 [Spirochaetes bacterium DG_61]
MRRLLVPLLILSTVFISLGCAKTAIKNTISDFEDAINDEYAPDLLDTLSPDSDFILSDPDATGFLFYFQSSGYIPVNYRNLDISVDGGDADVFSDGTYAGAPTDVKFWMRKEGGLFSADWRVFRYYDNGDFSTPVWRRPRD